MCGGFMDSILILDFGSQVSQLIARRVREAKVYSELHPYDVSAAFIRDFKPCGIILSGGPHSVYDEQGYAADPIIFELGVPILGICYGMQFMAQALGGKVAASEQREFGRAEVFPIDRAANLLFRNISPTSNGGYYVWMSHGDQVTQTPPGFKVIAANSYCPIAAMADDSRRYYGLQFHPEVTQTIEGGDILKCFAVDICRAKTGWAMPHFIDQAVADIRRQVGHEQVILGLSGGVDSAVAAALLHRAIGEQLNCVFVDHGLLRLGEAEQVKQTFAEHLGIKLLTVDASKRFLQHLAGVTDPEAKRKIIGRDFIDVFQQQARQLTQATWLAQGTIYPDVIESAGAKNNKAHSIKSHHNVGGLPESLNLKLLEPLRMLFKDEVRQLGLELGLPEEIVFRHPFPGPGLAVRIVGEVKPEFVDLLQRADAIFIEVLKKTKINYLTYYEATSQAFAVFLPIKSVGVMGDGRTYQYTIALRAVTTDDFMSAHWAELPHGLLAEVANRIVNEVPGINRVVYDISDKPPATIEWE